MLGYSLRRIALFAALTLVCLPTSMGVFFFAAGFARF